jgi:hypothetical protein
MSKQLTEAIQPFLDKGFKIIKKEDCLSQYADLGLQKLVTDDEGILYFVTVYVYDDYPTTNFSLDVYIQSNLLSRFTKVVVKIDTPEEALQIQKKIFQALQGIQTKVQAY